MEDLIYYYDLLHIEMRKYKKTRLFLNSLVSFECIVAYLNGFRKNLFEIGSKLDKKEYAKYNRYYRKICRFITKDYIRFYSLLDDEIKELVKNVLTF